MTDKTAAPPFSTAEIISMAREAEMMNTPLHQISALVTLVAERAAAAEREAMKPAIIKALQDNEREGHSYFLGADPGVSKDDYDDVAEEAIAIRARSKA